MNYLILYILIFVILDIPIVLFIYKRLKKKPSIEVNDSVECPQCKKIALSTQRYCGYCGTHLRTGMY